MHTQDPIRPTRSNIMAMVEEHPAVTAAALHEVTGVGGPRVNIAIKVLVEADPADVINDLANSLSEIIPAGLVLNIQAGHSQGAYR